MADDIYVGQDILSEGREVYEFQWHHAWNTVTTTKNGKTGWATILQSTNPDKAPGKIHRFHHCFNNPCTANWKPASYVRFPPPVHVQVQGPSITFAAVAGASGAHSSSSKADLPIQAVPEEEASPPPLPPPPSPPLDDGPVEPVQHEVIPQVEAPPSPKSNVLKGLQPAAPMSPINLFDECESAVAAHADEANAALCRVRSTLLSLARDIRKSGHYVGYSAFILMGLLMKQQPCVWEGTSHIDLLEIFAPWAKEACTSKCQVDAIPCSLKRRPDGKLVLIGISEQHPLQTCKHFVAGAKVLLAEAAVAGGEDDFEMQYASLGVAVLPSVLDGDCAFDVMLMMLGKPSSPAARKQMRIDLSDYLFARVGEPWMHDIMAVTQEVDVKDVEKCKLIPKSNLPLAAPAAPSAAVADQVASEGAIVPLGGAMNADPLPDAETIAAMRWSSKLTEDANVLSLIQSLPKCVIDEQVALYRERESAKPAVAEAKAKAKIRIGPNSKVSLRHCLAMRYHRFRQQALGDRQRLTWGSSKAFIAENAQWIGKEKELPARYLRRWYKEWKGSAAKDNPVLTKGLHQKTQLKSRATKADSQRRRDRGAGRQFQAPLVRKALYEWWSGLRHAIDWKALISERRSRGKKHLARFPRSAIILKVQQLLEDHAYATLINGKRVETFIPNFWWCKRWEEEYGLSFRRANRKFSVPRKVQKERLEILWVILFTIRFFIFRVFGYDPILVNFDQSPFHNNETGSQDKPTLNFRCAKVPIVEGNSDVKARWTANLTTVSKSKPEQASDPQSRLSQDNEQKPFHEIMFKAADDGDVYERLQRFIRSRGFPSWISVTVAPKGSYRSQDVIQFLSKHLDEWREGRDWRILLADDFAPHKMENARQLAWSRGYILIIHGGGTTPVAQTCDTDLNQYVRKAYGILETQLLLEKMRCGEAVPKLSHEESLLLMLEVLSNPQLHHHASEGYKKTGQSIDLFGKEDALVCREAGEFWNEETTDGYPNMRARIDAELAAVADEIGTGGITWSLKDVKRLIVPYPKRKDVDATLERLGEDYYHDAIEELDEDEESKKKAAVADTSDQEELSSSSADSDVEVPAAVAGKKQAVAEASANVDVEEVSLSAEQAEAVHQVSCTIAALQATVDNLRTIGSLRGAQCIEAELQKEKRRQRLLIQESPDIAEAFLQRRGDEEQRALKQRRLLDDQNEREKRAAKAIADRNAAVAELNKCKKAIKDLEGTRASKHAIKTFTLESLGEGSHNAGGAKAKTKRMEVLDRLARMNAGLSEGQRNDWPWFKEAWDKAMVTEHKENWAAIFSGWIQGVLDDERSNAFSVFVYNETCRIFKDLAALHVPGT